jgi:hypothetical protein
LSLIARSRYEKINHRIIDLAVGLLIGLGLGINIGKDKPSFSNNFSAPTPKEKL